MKKIVVIGSTGMLGKPVTIELIKAGFHVTALVRDRKKAEKVIGDYNIGFVNGDLRDRDSLKAAFSNHDGIYLNLSINPSSKETDFHTETNGLINVIDVAKEIGVKRISYLSSLKIKYQDDWWVLRKKKLAVNLLKSSGIPFTIFYPSLFMESIIKYRSGNSLMIVGNPGYPLYWIAGNDYGRQVARSFMVDEGNREYIIQGQKAYSQEEAFEIFIKNCQEEDLKIKNMPIGLLKYIGKFSQKINYEAKMAEYINCIQEKFEGKEAWDTLGEPTMTLEEFARQFQLKK